MTHDATPDQERPHGRRLNGWKEISSYFDRSTRTVQRWERECGLPVRRLGIGRGEVVYAWTGDLDVWQQAAERRGAKFLNQADGTDDGASGGETWRFYTRRSPVALGVGATAVVSLLLWAVSAALRPEAPGPGRPAARDSNLAGPSNAVPYRIDGDKLIALDGEGRPRWSHSFPYLLSPEVLQPHEALRRLVPVDINGDGRRELLFVSYPAEGHPTDWVLYCLSDRGELRWSRGPLDGRVFGGRSYTPLKADSIFVERVGGRVQIWAVFVHSPWFPSVLLSLNQDGQVTGEYWSAGHITLVRTVRVNGREVVLVGSRNNETAGASVAMLDARRPTGTAPAEDAIYQCADCPADLPLAFVQLPGLSILRGRTGSSAATRIEVEGPGEILVWVEHGGDIGYEHLRPIYALDASLRPLRVGFGDTYGDSLRKVFIDLGRSFPKDYDPITDYPPARWWDGQRFVGIPVSR